MLDKNFVSNIIVDEKNRIDYIKGLWDKLCQSLLLSFYYKDNKRLNHLLLTKDIESLEFVVDLFKSISKYKIQILDVQKQKMRQIICNHFNWLLSIAFMYTQQLSNQKKNRYKHRNDERYKGFKFI